MSSRLIFSTLVILFVGCNTGGEEKTELEKGTIEYFTQLIQEDSTNAMAYNNRGELKNNQGNYRGAISDYNRAIEADPLLALSFTNRGIAKFYLEDYSGAIQDYNRAVELDALDAVAFNNRGIARYYIGNPEGAIEDYAKAIKINPRYPDPYYNGGLLKIVYFENIAEGCEDLREAAELGYPRAGQAIQKFCQ